LYVFKHFQYPCSKFRYDFFPGERLFSLNEIQTIIATKAPPFETEENLKEAFSIFDKDGNGYVDVKEIRHVLVHLGEKLKDDQVDEMLRDVEISGDNQFNFEGNFFTSAKKSLQFVFIYCMILIII
jgi:Ca2+-binding EF-hand superfamily protein